MHQFIIAIALFLPLSALSAEHYSKHFRDRMAHHEQAIECGGDLMQWFIENVAGLRNCDWPKDKFNNEDYFQACYWHYAGQLYDLKPKIDTRFSRYQEKTNAVINNLDTSIPLIRTLAFHIKNDWDEYKSKSTPDDLLIKERLKLAADVLSRFALLHLHDYIPDWTSVCPIDEGPFISIDNEKKFTEEKKVLQEQFTQVARENKRTEIEAEHAKQVKNQCKIKSALHARMNSARRNGFWSSVGAIGLAFAAYVSSHSYAPYIGGAGSALCGLNALRAVNAYVHTRTELSKIVPVPEANYSSLVTLVGSEPTDQQVSKSLALKFNIDDVLK